ncbi:MAG: 50S ribosomal protein L22 [Candidatus Hydrogenedentes bacterium]|nr:50S ribosomal protein L22 [Candidatus Hydrogenedentota bacterium]
MAQAISRAKHVRVSARKVRLVADLIRGKKVSDALDILMFAPQGAAPVLKKVLASAVANAESAAAEARERIDTDEMIITQLLVDEGITMKRFRAAPRRRAVPIRKRTSHIHLVISER